MAIFAWLRPLLACIVGIAGAVVAAADEQARGLATKPWKLEAIELRDGRRLEGLIIEPTADPPADDADVFFVQVIRPPARPMYLITWGPLSADRIAALHRLPPADRERLAGRVQAFRDDRDRQVHAETEVTLDRDDENGPWRYATADFALESMTDPTVTREAALRLEQMFGALANLVPPTARPATAPAAPPARTTVRLCGTAAEYRSVQDALGIRVENPAFFVPARRLLVAGSDMPVLAAQGKAAAEANAMAARQLETLDRGIAAQLKSLVADLEKQGIPAAQRAEIVQKARSRWKQERDAESARIEAANRENAGRVESARRGFYARLAHEAWHAYAETRLRADDGHRLPRWLDEGIAQVVETAPLEAGELRLDAADPVRLAALQELLRKDLAPPLADLLAAGQDQFVAGHVGSREGNGRAYLVAWGLALDLAVLEPVLAPASLAAACRTADGSAGADPVRGFETLVGMPIDRFETAWRGRILALKSRAAKPAAAVSPGR